MFQRYMKLLKIVSCTDTFKMTYFITQNEE